MIETSLYDGKVARLAVIDPERDAETFSRWSHDPSYAWQVNDAPARPLSVAQARRQLEAMASDGDGSRSMFNFAVRARDGDLLIGFARLDVAWSNGAAQLVMGFGDAAEWTGACGREALYLVARYAFDELNLYRLEVKIGEDSAQAVQALQQFGFCIEVRRRQALHRGGARCDLLHLGLLRDEWDRSKSTGDASNGERINDERGYGPVNTRLFTGERVRLVATNPETLAEAVARWSLDSEFQRFDDIGPARPLHVKRLREGMDKEEPRDNGFAFAIHTLSDDRLIGVIGIDVTRWVHGDAYVGIAIGERDCWGKGYGTDAMRVMLRYAFNELNLHRVSLTVFEYNPRAIRSYEKAGFVVEGRLRRWLNREGRRWDMIHMAILRGDWEQGIREG